MGNPLSEGSGSDTFGNSGGDGSGQDGSTYQGNPSHQEFLNAIPEQYHEAVTPVLQKWDQGVNERFTKVQSEYAPWNDVIQSGNTPQDVTLALNVLQTMLNNPREIYDALNSQYNFADQTTGGQQSSQQNSNSGASDQGQNEPPDLQTAYDQRIAMIENNYQRLAEFMLNNQEQQQAAQEDQALEVELAGLKKKYGDFDEPYVLSQMLHLGKTSEEAVQMFQQMTGRIAQQGPRPLLLGASGGAVPGQGFNPVKASDKEAKDVAVEMINAMNAANRG